MEKRKMKGFNLLTLTQYNNLPEQDKKQYFNLVRGLDMYASKTDIAKLTGAPTYDPATGILQFPLQDGTFVDIDLPLELIVDGGFYDADTTELVLVLANDDEIRIPVGDLLVGIATEEYVDTKADTKVDKQQDVLDAGKLLGVGADGKVLTVTAPSTLTPEQEQKIDGIKIDGDGTKFLNDKLEYVEVSGGGALTPDSVFGGTINYDGRFHNLVPALKDLAGTNIKDIDKELYNNYYFNTMQNGHINLGTQQVYQRDTSFEDDLGTPSEAYAYIFENLAGTPGAVFSYEVSHDSSTGTPIYNDIISNTEDIGIEKGWFHLTLENENPLLTEFWIFVFSDIDHTARTINIVFNEYYMLKFAEEGVTFPLSIESLVIVNKNAMFGLESVQISNKLFYESNFAGTIDQSGNVVNNIGLFSDGNIVDFSNEIAQYGYASNIYYIANESGALTINEFNTMPYNAGDYIYIDSGGWIQVVPMHQSGGSINVSGIDYIKDPDKTYLVIKIPYDNDEFILYTGYGIANYTIEWGDGSSDNITGTSIPNHTYEKAGMYLITISGDFANGIAIGDYPDADKDKIIEVYGGSNYPTDIRDYAFNGCTNLTTTNFPNATYIGNNAFQGCSRLTEATFPNVTHVGSNAFSSCTNLTTTNFPKVTSLGASAFSSCTNLTTVTFPRATSVEGYTFSNCSRLTEATFPQATSIGFQDFHSCGNLTTATFPRVTSIGNNVFDGCSSLTTATFQNVISIGSDAFIYCSSLKNLTLGNVTTTETGTRFENVKLVNLTIAQDVDTTDIDRIKTFFTDNGGTFTGAQINSI